jgi:hypothetical protein
VLTGLGRHRQKVSTIAAISVAPGRRRLGLYRETDPGECIDAGAVFEFLRGLLRHLKGQVSVVWDGGSNHKGPAIRALLERYSRLHLEGLPGYAPGLSPVEMLWAYLKHGLMANFVAADVLDLEEVVLAHLASVRGDPKCCLFLRRSCTRGRWSRPSPAPSIILVGTRRDPSRPTDRDVR